MSLLHDIQAAAISQDADVPTLLRMCKLLAARISHQQFAQWVDHELNGYPDVSSLPEYRVVRVDSYGNFVGAFGASAQHMQIPLSVLPKDLRESFAHAYMASSISAYTALLAGDKTGRIQEAWPLGLAVHNASKIMREMQCVAAWKEIPIGAVIRLMDSVKTRVLGFVIDLERAAPDAGNTPIGSRPPVSSEKMTQIFNTNISGNVGNLSNSGTDFSQTATVEAGNWGSLSQQLQALGLKANDYEEMRSDLEPVARSGTTDEKRAVASTWIGRLTGKALHGLAGVGIEVAAAGIAKAIASYLGLPGA